MTVMGAHMPSSKNHWAIVVAISSTGPGGKGAIRDRPEKTSSGGPFMNVSKDVKSSSEGSVPIKGIERISSARSRRLISPKMARPVDS
jgi:hypothetical protein